MGELSIPDPSDASLFSDRANRRNIELKARLVSLREARRTAGRLCERPAETQLQVDTYFYCRAGRLKLRQIDGRLGQLIWYFRPDRPGPKGSDYRLVETERPERLLDALSATLGVRVVVRKRREIFLYENVRIHLDEVTELGAFLEFEAVLDGRVDDARGEEKVRFLTEQFGIGPDDGIACSYGELLQQQASEESGE